MTENSRTATFIGAALVLLVAAGFINRKPAVEEEGSLAGKVLFPELKSPGEVSGLEIVSFDASDSRPNVFKVVRDATGWTLPSHSNYPADAEKQVGSAASSLIDLKVLSVESRLPSEHAKYGVVAPDPEKAPPGAEGVGKLVTVLDKSGKSLARLVIGHEDKRPGDSLGSEESELRFVRALPHDLVYRVLLPAAKFSTSFADWIETDLLKLDPWNITQVTLKDYTFDIGEDAASGQIVAAYDQTSNIDLKFNEKDAKWSLEKLVEFKEGKENPVELADNEELNATRLNEMKTALDDLKIVDVRRKPAGMSGNLKAKREVFTDPEAAQSLIQRGFFPGRAVGDDAEILSSDGEVLVRMKDGVEYILRFGRTAGVGSEEKMEADSKEAKESGKDDEESGSGTNLNRFIMVSAQFNPDLIPKPDLEDVPGGAGDKPSEQTTGSDSADTKEGTAKSEEAKSGDAKSANDAAAKDESKKATKADDDQGKAKTSGDAQKKAGAQAEPKDGKSAQTQREPLHFVTLQDEPKKGDAKPGDVKAKGDKAAAKSKAGESDKGTAAGGTAKKQDSSNANQKESSKKESANADDAAKAGDDSAEGKDAKKRPSAEEQEELALERKRIETENQRKQKEYDEQIKKGEERARELNDRFADWYYVVSESTYRKIHLGRDDVIRKKAEEKSSGDADAAKSDDADAGIDAGSLKVPPLKSEKSDPFKKRDEAKKEEAAKEKDE
jgi:hypothetical protein